MGKRPRRTVAGRPSDPPVTQSVSCLTPSPGPHLSLSLSLSRSLSLSLGYIPAGYRAEAIRSIRSERRALAPRHAACGPWSLDRQQRARASPIGPRSRSGGPRQAARAVYPVISVMWGIPQEVRVDTARCKGGVDVRGGQSVQRGLGRQIYCLMNAKSLPPLLSFSLSLPSSLSLSTRSTA